MFTNDNNKNEKKKKSSTGIRICQVISESLGSFWENQFLEEKAV